MADAQQSQPGKPGWFSTGFDEVDKVAAAQKARRSVFDRFALKFDRQTSKGEEATVVFIDPDSEKDVPGFWEHEYDTLDGAWYNYTLCSQGVHPCVMCERGIPRYFAGGFSIIRISPTRDQQGKEYINQRQLLIAKTESMQRLRRMFQARQGLVGTVWSVFRTSNRAAKIGDDWQFLRKIEGGREGIARELKVGPEVVKPYNYAETLIMKSRESLLSEPVDWAKSADKNKRFDNEGGGRGGHGGGGGGGRSQQGSEVRY